jgi:Rrf2 family protein
MSDSILKISEAASLGLHSMIILAKHSDNVVSVKDIAGELNVSANHLSKVLQRLSKADFIESSKGNKGGFRLIAKPQDINFLQIYEAIDGKLKLSDCLISTHNTKCKCNCIMGDLLVSVNKQVVDYFQNTKLSDFLK